MQQPPPFPHGNATHSNLRLRDANDAHVLFQAVRQGHLPLIRKRLTGPEQHALHAGQVFVWADREGSLERWTDGHNWSPSRVRGPFLMYDEMPDDTEAFQRRKQQQKAGERRVKQPRKKRLPPLPGGLSKQTYSATLIQQGMDIQKWHLTAYFKDDGSNDLMSVDDDDLLRTIIVPEATFKSSMSRKSKGSTSRRRNSVSEARSVATMDDDDFDDRRGSPIDEHSPRSGAGGFPSPPLLPVGDAGSNAAFDFSLGSSGIPSMTLPWQQQQQPHHQPFSRDDGSGGSGSSAGSAGTVTTSSQYFQPQQQQFFGPGGGAAVNRGRNMHLEGIHTRFDAPPHFAFSALDASSAGRSQSLNGLPSEWQQDVDRRGSLMSSSRSNSSHSTSASSKLLNNGGGLSTSSNSSSPASSWSQQSPYLNPTTAPSNPTWPSFGNTSPQQKHIPSPLAVVIPNSLPTAYRGSSKTLPSHIQHHPDHVPSAVPPPSSLPPPSRRQTLPALYPFDAGNFASPTSSWSPALTSAPYYSPQQQYPSPFDASSTQESSTYRPQSYFPQQRSGSQHDQKSADIMHHPRAAVIASGIPGSWEASERRPSSSSFDLAPFQSAPPPASDLNLNSPPQQSPATYGDVFESVVPNPSSTEYLSHRSWGPN